MKYLIFLLLPLNLMAQESFSFGYSMLTHHWSTTGSDRFANKASKDGRTIKNPMYSIGFTQQEKYDYTTNSVFVGSDSIGSPIVGFSRTNGKEEGIIQLGVIYGLYLYDQKQWDKVYADQKYKSPSYLSSFGISNVNIILGVELNLKFDLGSSAYFQIRNVVTPILTNHSLNLGFYY